jgi:hypothetical protein
MNDSLLPQLRKTALQTIRKANRPGGSLENGTFTMGIARREISSSMGLGADGLDEKKWKVVVKQVIEQGMVGLDTYIGDERERGADEGM